MSAANEYITPVNTIRVPCPTTVLFNDAVLIGVLPAVALTSYDANDGKATFALVGSHLLSVIAKSSISPSTGSAAKPGDALYATGTLDATTNITTGLTISKTSTGTAFGNYIGTGITSSSTDTAAPVRLAGGSF